MSRKGSTAEKVYWDGRMNTQSTTSSRELIESVNIDEDTQQPKKMMVKCSTGCGFGGAQEREVYVPDTSFLKRRYFSNSNPKRTVRIEESLPYGSEKAKISREYAVIPGYESILGRGSSRYSSDSVDKHSLNSDLAYILITRE